MRIVRDIKKYLSYSVVAAKAQRSFSIRTDEQVIGLSYKICFKSTLFGHFTIFLQLSLTIKKYLSYSVVAAKAQLESEVANSYLNWLWWIIEPLCMMFVYAFIFGTVFNIKEKNHALFIFIGLMMYDFFSRSVKSSIKIVKRNKIKK